MTPLPGYIYFDKNFEFEDGTIGQKIFVVLCDSDKNKDNVLAARTTTTPKSKQSEGCHDNYYSGKVFYIQKGNSVFVEDTWIQFDYIVEYKSEILGRWNRIGELSLAHTKALLLCGSASDTLANWQKDQFKILGEAITP